MLLAAQVVLSLSEVNVGRVRLLVDGEPLLPDRRDLTREDVAGLSAEVEPGADVPGLVVAGGRVRQLTGPEPSAPLPGPLGNGAYDVESAASTVDGRRLAAVFRVGGQRTLLVGGLPEGGVTPVPLTADDMTRPSWTPTGGEVWTVLDSAVVARVLVDDIAPPRTGRVNADELAALGPIQDLRLSRDGMRVVAVVGGGLYTGAVARTIDGEVAIRNVRRLRPDDLGAGRGGGLALHRVDRRDHPQPRDAGRTGHRRRPRRPAGAWATTSPPPLTAIAAAANRPLLVTDQTGVWSFGGGDQVAWRQVLGGAPDAVPLYPG